MGRKVLIISPVRNEEQYIGKTLESVVHQSVKPAEWVIVDDHSTDGTRGVIDSYRANYPWISCVTFPPEMPRVPGGKVVRIFAFGLANASLHDYDYLVKLDTDLELSPDYFEKILKKFEEDPSLGIASGMCLEKRDGDFVEEPVAEHHAHGASKVYRRTCFEDIGGLISTLGWDGLDEYTAMFKGWKTRHFREMTFKHFRPTGAEGGVLKGKFRMGYSFWLIGYHPLYIIARCFRKLFQPPPVIGSIAIFWGYIVHAVKGTPHASSPELRKYIHRVQLSKLGGYYRKNRRPR